jgi:hypothetical protein
MSDVKKHEQDAGGHHEEKKGEEHAPLVGHPGAHAAARGEAMTLVLQGGEVIEVREDLLIVRNGVGFAELDRAKVVGGDEAAPGDKVLALAGGTMKLEHVGPAAAEKTKAVPGG